MSILTHGAETWTWIEIGIRLTAAKMRFFKRMKKTKRETVRNKIIRI
jgi:hypothetical protein